MHVFTNSLLFSILDDNSSPTDFDVRLRVLFGPSLVEVYYTNSWLPVCTQDWNRSYGVAVCRQTGYATYITSYSSPTQTNSLHLTGVLCTGRERNLTECNRAGVEAIIKNCHNVIVKCASKLLMTEREEEMCMYMYISVVCCCVQCFLLENPNGQWPTVILYTAILQTDRQVTADRQVTHKMYYILMPLSNQYT